MAARQAGKVASPAAKSAAAGAITRAFPAFNDLSPTISDTCDLSDP